MKYGKLTKKEYAGLNRVFNEDTLLKVLVVTPLKYIVLDNEPCALDAGLEFAGHLEEKLEYGKGLELDGHPSLKTLAIVAAFRTDQGRLIVTDNDGGIYLIEIILHNS